MSDPLYHKDLLRLAAEANGAGRLASPDASGFAYNPACGDKVVFDLRLEDGRIAEVAHDTKACVLAQASASILGATLNAKDETEIVNLLTCVEKMLANGPAPPPPFEGYAVFVGVAEYKSRHRCVLLPIEAVMDALAKAKKR